MLENKVALEQILIAFADQLMNQYMITENYKISTVEKVTDGYNPESVSDTRPEQKIEYTFSATKPTRSKLISDAKIFVQMLDIDDL